MVRRLKDELAKQRSVNATLQTDLDQARSASPSETGSRIRPINGRNTPISSDEQDSLRGQLADAQRQSQRLSAENQDLQRKVEGLQRDLEHLREQLASTQREAEARLSHVEELENDIERLESSLEMLRSGSDDMLVERLTNETMQLKRENEELSHKVGLLLEVDHATNGRARPISGVSLVERRTSNTSSENGFHHDSDDWRPSGLDRPLSSEYDEPGFHLREARS
jgi:chromosome segregation ATPase